jgi:hypothetical protein
VSLEVVTELASREDHCVEQLLDLRITRLCLGQNLADVIYRPLDWQGVPLLRALYYDDSADHLSGRGDVEVQRLAVLSWRRIGAWASVAFNLSSASWALTVQEKRSCFFRSR